MTCTCNFLKSMGWTIINCKTCNPIPKKKTTTKRKFSKHYRVYKKI